MYTRIDDDTIKEFFRCSIARDFSSFDWDGAFEDGRQRLQYYLDMHGLGTEEAFRDWYDDVYGARDIEKRLDIFTISTAYIHIDTETIKDAIYHCIYTEFRKAFENVGEFITLKEIIEKIDNCPESDSEHAILFDEIIHAQHVSGDIFEDVDITALKAEIDAEYALKNNIGDAYALLGGN